MAKTHRRESTRDPREYRPTKRGRRPLVRSERKTTRRELAELRK